MRVSSTQYHATMNTALQNANARLESVMQQMASGKQHLLPSDDPIAHVRLSRMTREDAALNQYIDNIGALNTRLRQNEETLSNMVRDMLDVRDLLVWASDGSNAAADLNAMASSIDALRDSLFYSANSHDQEGMFLFSGTASMTATVSHDATLAIGSRYTSTGDTGKQQVVVGQGITQVSNVDLNGIHNVLNELDSIAMVLKNPTVSANTAPTRAALQSSFTALDDALNSVNSKIARLGGTQNILETLEGNHRNVRVSNQQAMITLGQLDYSEAATRLTGYTSALQATQKAYSKVSGLSLFDLI